MYLEFHDSARDHPKILKLARDLHIEEPHALGYMASLWGWALRMAPDGDLSSFDVEDIEIGAKWSGDPGAFVKAAHHRKLLDFDGEFYAIHDWPIYAQHLKAAERKRKERQLLKSAGPGAVVYFARINKETIKIGYSENVLRRMSEHAFDYGVQPVPIGFIRGGRALESEIHERFSHLRDGKLEHFMLDNELRDYITGHVTHCDPKWKAIPGSHRVTPPVKPNEGVTLTDRPTDQKEQTERPTRTRPREEGEPKYVGVAVGPPESDTIEIIDCQPDISHVLDNYIPKTTDDEFLDRVNELDDDGNPPGWRNGELTWLKVFGCWAEYTSCLDEPFHHRAACESLLRMCLKSNPTNPRANLEAAVKYCANDPWVREHHPTPNHLAKNFTKYLSGPPQVRAGRSKEDDDYRDLSRRAHEAHQRFEQAQNRREPEKELRILSDEYKEILAKRDSYLAECV